MKQLFSLKGNKIMEWVNNFQLTSKTLLLFLIMPTLLFCQEKDSFFLCSEGEFVFVEVIKRYSEDHMISDKYVFLLDDEINYDTTRFYKKIELSNLFYIDFLSYVDFFKKINKDSIFLSEVKKFSSNSDSLINLIGKNSDTTFRYIRKRNLRDLKGNSFDLMYSISFFKGSIIYIKHDFVIPFIKNRKFSMLVEDYDDNNEEKYQKSRIILDIFIDGKSP